MKKVATARKGAKRWAYKEVDVREDIETQLPPDWELKVYKVRSGDSGDSYYVRVLRARNASNQRVVMCNCWQGQELQPLLVLGIGDPCKHGANLLTFLKETDD